MNLVFFAEKRRASVGFDADHFVLESREQQRRGKIIIDGLVSRCVAIQRPGRHRSSRLNRTLVDPAPSRGNKASEGWRQYDQRVGVLGCGWLRSSFGWPFFWAFFGTVFTTD